ncbi:cytochrome b5 domain-containing protein [Patescibacteria group bacterium]|nr:cytochrome b5 domain-containing protein [Patescibacteria group bacterium]MBU2259652.1 cytochrome b5 domain-containing protein [Patescibacteria group bacterium]
MKPLLSTFFLLGTLFLIIGCSQDTASTVTPPNAQPNEQLAQQQNEPAGTEVFSMETVAAHNTNESCYTAVDGLVYDLTPFIDQHPGGDKNIMKICGRDGTNMFTRKHGENDKAQEELASLQIGVLEQ